MTDVTFADVEAYRNFRLRKGKDVEGLPRHDREFSNWWEDICLSDELRDRWVQRFAMAKTMLDRAA